jgi:DNA-binding IclR family transcriptional regulator
MGDTDTTEVLPAPTGGVASVERALSIMNVFAAATAPLTLADLARSTGLYKSTALRLLASLEQRGYVVRQRDGRYHLGAMAFRLGLAYERTHGLKAHLAPILEDLVARNTESPSFHIRYDASHRLCLLRLDSNHATLDRIRAGDLLPLDRGAPGRVISAADDPAMRHRSLVVSTCGELNPACGGLACPVFGPGNLLVGALSLSGPMERFSPDAIARMTPALLDAAIAATRALGGNPAALAQELRVHQTGAAVT